MNIGGPCVPSTHEEGNDTEDCHFGGSSTNEEGHLPKNAYYFVVPHMKREHLDNEQANKTATISYNASRGVRNCRTCDCESSDFYPSYTKDGNLIPMEHAVHVVTRLRSSVFTELVSGLSQDYFIGRIKTTKGSPYSHEETIIAQLRKQYSIAHFRNPMYGLYRFWEKFGLGSLHVMTIIDRLHTVILGLLAYCFRWSMAITFCSARSDAIRESGGDDPVALMDQRAKFLSTRQAFNPCASDTHRPMENLKQGFSFGFKDTTTQTEALKHGIITGGNIDGSMMVDLLFGFLLCLGHYGNIVPNCALTFRMSSTTNSRRSNTSTTTSARLSPPLNKANPTTAILEAGWAAMELNLLLGGDHYTDDDVGYLENLIKVVIEKTTYLYYVKQAMVGSQGKKPKTNKCFFKVF